jgi:hypothetical protein
MIRREAYESGLGARSPGLRARLRPATAGKSRAGPRSPHENEPRITWIRGSSRVADADAGWNYLIRASRRIQG